MKLTRASYPIFFALIIFGIIRPTIEAFSEEIEEQIFLPAFIISIILIIISLVLAIIDKELFHVITDERTKKVDRSAGYYSWWFTIIFAFILGFTAYIKNFTILQYTFILLSEMLLTMIIFHMYFNFKGE